MEWISVKDNLPKPNEVILTYEKNSWRQRGNFKYKILVYTDAITKGKYLFMDKDSTSYEITHWMELPDAPPNNTLSGKIE